MTQAFIGIGSNDNAADNIKRGFNLLRGRVEVVRVSSFYETPPLQGDGKPYINAVAMLETDLSALELKALLVSIEDKLGRDRSQKAIIPLDFDLLMLGDSSIEYEFNGKMYSLPDSDILERDFVAMPLAEIAPDVIHPVTKQSFAEITTQLGSDNLKLVK